MDLTIKTELSLITNLPSRWLALNITIYSWCHGYNSANSQVSGQFGKDESRDLLTLSAWVSHHSVYTCSVYCVCSNTKTNRSHDHVVHTKYGLFLCRMLVNKLISVPIWLALGCLLDWIGVGVVKLSLVWIMFDGGGRRDKRKVETGQETEQSCLLSSYWVVYSK